MYNVNRCMDAHQWQILEGRDVFL